MYNHYFNQFEIIWALTIVPCLEQNLNCVQRLGDGVGQIAQLGQVGSEVQTVLPFGSD
jgi:hypothetical protein